MVRVALLVTVLAALCYTSQAIPAQVENKEFESRKEISDQIQQVIDHIPQEVKDKIEDFSNKFLEYLKQFEKDFQEKERRALNVFEKAKENAMKWLQERNTNVNEVLEKLKKVKQEIETNYQYELNNGIQNIKDIVGKFINDDLKQKVKEELDSFQRKVKETIGGVLRKKQSSGESYVILEKGKGIMNSVQEKFTESSKKIINDTDETVKKFKERVNQILEKNDKIKELKNNLDKSLDKLKERVIKNSKGETKDEAGKVKRSVSNVIRDRQPASIIGGVLDTANNFYEEGKKGMRIIGDSGINTSKNVLDNIKKLIDEALGAEKGSKEDVKEDIKEDTEDDTEST